MLFYRITHFLKILWRRMGSFIYSPFLWTFLWTFLESWMLYIRSFLTFGLSYWYFLINDFLIKKKRVPDEAEKLLPFLTDLIDNYLVTLWLLPEIDLLAEVKAAMSSLIKFSDSKGKMGILQISLHQNLFMWSELLDMSI